jgi:hypothetical protein
MVRPRGLAAKASRHERSGGRSSSAERTLARELLWLDEVLHGSSVKEIAKREGLSRRRVQLGIARSRKYGISPQETHSRVGNQAPDRVPAPGLAHLSATRHDKHRPPRLVPLFPIGEFTPKSECPHHGPLRAGSVLCCMVCSRSGVDDHPALVRDCRTDPRPARRPAAAVLEAGVRETRKQRRQRRSAAKQSNLGVPGDSA